MTTPAAAERVLSFWFGPLDARGCADEVHTARWWNKDPAFDAECRDRFLDDHAAAMAGERDAWLATPRGRLAYVILLDQLSRNMFRDRPEMYAGDDRARFAAADAIAGGDDDKLAFHERVFLYMPFMHSEDVADQDRCVSLYRALVEESDDPELRDKAAGHLKFAGLHRDIVARFGRFPHRNAILRRETTEEEALFLQQPGSGF